MRTFTVKSYGCQMNAYDSERMTETLLREGLTEAGEGPADVVVLNTCHIREKAAEKVYSEVGRIVKIARKQGREKPVIAVAGCVAQAEGSEIMRRSKAVDVVVGPQAYHRLPQLLKEGHGAVDLDMPASPKFDHLPARSRRSASAFLTVQEGCDKFCAFCVVPYTRGGEASRPLAAIIGEAKRLVAGGAREITLLGQNVNAYADPVDSEHGFGTLLRAVAGLPGVERLRYTTSHPRDVTDAMIAAHATIAQLMPYLHLPVQSGSNQILAAMNRRHDRAFYLGLIDRFRAARPDLAITSDFIVGFPGESDADFSDTMGLVEEVGYAQAYSFKYSPRLGTPAAEREDQVPEEVKAQRLERLQGLLASQSLAFNRQSVGKICSVLIERKGRRPGQWIGKSPWLQSVVIDDKDLAPGMIIEAELMAAGPNSLEGRAIDRKKAA